MKSLHEIGSNANKELYDTTKKPSLFSMCSWPYHRKGIRPDGRKFVWSGICPCKHDTSISANWPYH